MSIYRVIVFFFIVGVLCSVGAQSFSQRTRPPLPKTHRHFGVTRAATGETILEFRISEATLEPGTKKEGRVTNPARTYEAFIVSDTRLFIAERASGKVFEILGLPLEWRPFSDLTWADSRTLMFDRWSQPHYGVHYSLDFESRKLLAAVPFPDEAPKRR